MTDYAITIHSLAHKYGNNAVLNDINLRIRKGEFITLVGPSGCGKSTLLRMILGEEHPLLGKVNVEGRAKTRPGPDVGIVYQQYSIFPHLTAVENVAFGPTLLESTIPERLLFRFTSSYKSKVARIEERAEKMLGMVKLGDARNKYPHELSGGMRQRIAIAQVLIMDPPVLLMDEPFSALDEFTREQIQLDLLRIWREKQMTIIFVTHALEEAVFLGTRILVLSQHYWSENDGFDSGGSRIVMDLEIKGGHSRTPEFKESKEMMDLLGRIRHNRAFTSTTKGESLHIGEFALEHPDAVQLN